ncbi:WD40 repeat-like protein [Xylona heveae TC161]|uniref:WD40 repeat-like protein n=1 Tax=Xylona heveae (strain CBS 132557 / TC161) TaxID=1328760 RepID=A0A165IEQ0_XYLHT|nr:WD40 repeat-like protein [Xylona heveae TC161]KZF24788.1 WD40 repeat-like protein [Xylona heveae TC161]
MNSYLLNRALGVTSPQAFERAQTTRLAHALQPAPHIRFSSRPTSSTTNRSQNASTLAPGGQGTEEDESNNNGNAVQEIYAHNAGVNALTIDKFEGKYMLSGGADSSIFIWDLEQQASENANGNTNDDNDSGKRSILHTPAGAVKRSSSTHKFGITQLSFYPFDSLAFLSSSFDHTLKISSSITMAPSASFDLGSVIYSHALSPIADHLLVACATQHPAVRLVDLRSGASTHSLAGHHGAVLSVAWSPRDEYVLASSGTDGGVRLWDVRRSAGCLGVLDMEDSVGICGYDGLGTGARRREKGKAHNGAANGVVWTDDGNYIITVGHDERIRVWDAATSANTLASFGPIIKNTRLAPILPALAPTYMTPPGKPLMFYPNEREILAFDLFEGRLLKRLRAPGTQVAAATKAAQRNLQNRVTALAWRQGDVEMYSAHSDGLIRTWRPRTREDAELEEQEAAEAKLNDEEDETRKRKRQVLEDIYHDLTRQKVTFT